jgi:predicted phosphodiesterase
MHGLLPGATTASINLNWWSNTNEATSGSQAMVRLFDASGTNLLKTETGTSQTVSLSSVGSQYLTGKPRRRHRVAITGLTPNTSYKYSVSNNGYDWSNLFDYKTPANNSFIYAAVADPQVSHTNTYNNGLQDANSKYSSRTTAWAWNEAVEKIANKGASFIVSAGDQVDKYDYSEHEYENFFAPAPLRNIPYAPVVGNHDLHTQYLEHFYMPNLPSSTSSYSIYSGGINYYYLYNNILFVALNTGSIPKSLSDAQTYVDGFKNIINAAKAAHSGYDWLIVQHHKSTTSVSAHACDAEIYYYVQAGLEKLMTEQGVDLVITGHDHIYVRSNLMKWDNAKGYSVKSEDKGTVYLTLGASGGIKYYPAFYLNPNDPPDPSVPYPVLADLTKGSENFSKGTSTNNDKWPLSTLLYNPKSFYPPQNNVPSYTIFEVNGKSMAVTTRTIDEDIVDSYTLTPKGR